MAHGQTILRHLYTILDTQAAGSLADGQLLERFVSRHDESAFNVLMRRHARLVWSVCRNILPGEQDAEDAFQATFLVLARRAEAIRKGESVGSWLYGVAHRVAMKAKKAAAKRVRYEREGGMLSRSKPGPRGGALGGRAGETMTPGGGELALRELQAILHEELQRLPEKYRTPFVLCCLEGRGRKEVAEELGWKEGTVSSRIAQARLQLQRRLTRRGVALSAVLCAMSVWPKAAPAALVAKAAKDVLLFTAGKGEVISAPVAALAEGVIKAMALGKAKVGMALVLVVSLVGAGVGLSANRVFRAKPQVGDAPEAPAIVAAAFVEPEGAKPARTDLYGDALPDGAAMRLGTLQRRAVGAKLALTPDGKSVISVQNGKYVSVWNSDDGKLRKTWELPAKHLGLWVLSPSGRWLATDGSSADGSQRTDTLTIWDVQTGKPAHRFTVKGAQQIFPVVFTPDEKRLGIGAMIGNERLVRVWELAGEKEVFSKQVRSNFFSNLMTFSPDGKRLLASFMPEDLGTFCWDVEAGKQLWQNKEFHPVSMGFTADGKIVSSTSNFPVLLDAGTGRFERRPKSWPQVKQEKLPPAYWENRLTMMPDGKTALISTSEGVIVWDSMEGKELRTLAGAGDEAVVSPDGKVVVTNNGSLQRWDLATGKPMWQDNFDQGHVAEVRAVAFSADSKKLASSSADGSVRLWDVSSGRPLHVWRIYAAQRPPIGTLSGVMGGVRSFDFSRNGRWIVTAGGERQIALRDTSTGRVVQSIPFPEKENGELDNPLFHLCISADDTRLMAVFGGWTVMNIPADQEPTLTNPHHLASWDLKTGQLEKYPSIPHIMSAEEVSTAISPDGRTLLSKGVLLDATTGKELVRLEGTELSQPRGVPFVFSPDGALIVGDLTEKNRKLIGIGVWETATGKKVAQVPSWAWGEHLAFHPTLPLVAGNGLSGLEMCDVITGKKIAAPLLPQKARGSSLDGPYVSCLTFSPDGRYLASGHPDGTILLWNVPGPARRTEKLQQQDLDRLWNELMVADAAKAWKAVWQLADCSEAALPFLQQRLKPSPTVPESVTQPLLTDLDNDSFPRREQVAKRLKELNWQAEPALYQALKGNPSPEKRRRIQDVLKSLAAHRPTLTPEILRELRAVTVLSRIDSPDARRLLEELATGPESAPLTRQARASLLGRK